MEQSDRLTAAQIAESSEYLLGGVVHVVQGLVLTMGVSPWEFKPVDSPPPDIVPESVGPIVVQPPPTPSDGPPGPPGGDPTPSSVSPEPGTLVGGLLGTGALMWRYLRRRRRKPTERTDEMDEAACEMQWAAE